MKNGLSSVYVSAEASASSIIQNAESYGWKKDKFYTLPPKWQDITTPDHKIFVFGRDTTVGENADDTLESLSGDFFVPSDITIKPEQQEKLMEFFSQKQWVTQDTELHPQVIVVDSLNTLGEKAPQKLWET